MTVRDLVRKVVCEENVDKVVYINGRAVVTTESNLALKVSDFRIVCKETYTNIFIETKDRL